MGLAVRSVETAVSEDGRSVHAVEGKFWTTLAVDYGAPTLRDAMGRDPSTNPDLAPVVEGVEVLSVDDKTAMLRGVASSTSIDTYGTEMSRACLDHMAEQFRAGAVEYAPTHADREWDQTIGRVVGASVDPATTRAPADESEPQYVLTVDVELDLVAEKANLLLRKVKAGRKIGQSIGGWFRKITFVENEGAIERVIVERVDLDHLAATRSPSNPDSDVLSVLSKAIVEKRADPDGDGTIDGEDLIIDDEPETAEPDVDDEPETAESEVDDESEDEPDVDDEVEDDEDEDEDDEERSDDALETRGKALGATLREAIKDKMAKSDMSRADVVKGMAEAAKIDVTTVRDIIRGHIQCPPIHRLSAFASYLGVSTDSLVGAAESDSCTYDRSAEVGALETRSEAGVVPEQDRSQPNEEAAVPTNETDIAAGLAAILSEVTKLGERVAAVEAATAPEQKPDPETTLNALRVELERSKQHNAEIMQKVLAGRSKSLSRGISPDVETALKRTDERAQAADALESQGAATMAYLLRSQEIASLATKPKDLKNEDLELLINMACNAAEADGLLQAQ